MEPMHTGETFSMGRRKVRVLVLAARQPGFSELLEHAGFDVEMRTRPLSGTEQVAADVAVVFRGRLIGRNQAPDRKSTRLNSSHSQISYAVFCLKKKTEDHIAEVTDEFGRQLGDRRARERLA